MFSIVRGSLASALAFGFMFTPAMAAPGRLPVGVTPIHYDISVKPDAEKLTFTGNSTIRIKVSAPTPTITLNAVDLDIGKASLDGVVAQSLKLNPKEQTLTLTFAQPVNAGEHKLAFEWKGKINQSASGLFALDYKGVDGKDARMLATQFEAPDARRFAPMFDEPGLKATFTLTALSPKGQTAYSNMPVTAKVDTPEGTLWSFAETPKMSSYLLFLGMGDIERKTIMAGKTEIGIITRKGVVDQGDYSLESAKRLIEYFNDYFGTPYPLPKLDMIAAPGSSQFFGAMENWGAIFYFERTVLIDPKLITESQRQSVFATVGHEIAHQWFGNLVTMAWWDDLWLNEGFASWMESKVSNDLNPQWQIHAQSVTSGRQGAMNLDSRATTHPIVQRIQTVDQISQAFDTITYQKGESIIGMLEATIGAEPFRAGIRNYMKKYAYANTVTSQLWDELAATSGAPVASIMNGFTTQGGVPMIRASGVRCINGQTRLNVSQSRFGIDDASKTPLRWQVPVAFGLAGGGEQPLKRMTISGATPVSIALPGCGLPVVNYGQKSYLRTLYEPAYFAKLKEGFATLSVDDQIGLLADSSSMGVAGYAPIRQHLDLISTLNPSASPLVWDLVAAQLSGFNSRMKGTADLPAYRRKAAALLAPVFKQVGWEAKPGEDTVVAQLRETLLPVIAELGDAEVIGEAKRYLDLSFTKPDAVSGPIRLIALSAYASNADPAGWDALRERAKSEAGPVAKGLYYSALGSTIDPALAQRALDIALTQEAPVPVRSSIIAAVASEHPELAFDWAVKHKDAVNAILDESVKSEFIVGLASGGSNLALAQRVTAYANANLAPESRATARQVVSFITVRAALKAKLAPAIGQWARGSK
jgi:aminopeptidase N